MFQILQDFVRFCKAFVILQWDRGLQFCIILQSSANFFQKRAGFYKNENVFCLQPTHLRKSCHVGECHMQFTDIFPGIVCSRRSDRSVVNLSIFLDMRSQQETHVSHAMLAMLCRGSLWLYFCTTRYFVKIIQNQISMSYLITSF